MRNVRFLLAQPQDGYQGAKGSYWFIVVLTVLTTVRSLIHILAPDGGANSIAGIEVEGVAGDNLVHLFAQWGLEQLILASVSWVIVTRYRFLVPFAILLQLIDWSMRFVIGELKPLYVDNPPPGAVANFIFVPLCAIALWFALPRLGRRSAEL